MGGPLLKFIRLPSAERRLVVDTVFAVTAARLALWLLPSRLVLRSAARSTVNNPPSRLASRLDLGRIVWAVRAVSRRVPAASCLTQALAARSLLAKHGHPSTLRVGVARDKQRDFQAHAWLEAEGRVVIGGEELERYTELPDLKEALE